MMMMMMMMFAGQHWPSVRPTLDVCWPALAQCHANTRCLLAALAQCHANTKYLLASTDPA